ncbi:MAG: nicotinate-nucleotide adenylyltransferase [candidate division WOR-3 bacterium]|jgi:nicotinate-nucleotide adenylyltransferase
MRLGIFGGSFDPVHFGHLLVAEDVLQKMRLDRLLFVPAFHPPHRPAPIANYKHRVTMLRLAVGNKEKFGISLIEESYTGPSYTVNTLRRLRTVAPGARFYLIVGYDQYRRIHTWHQPARLTRLARLVIVSRPGVSKPPLFPGHNRHRVRFLNVIPVGISSRLIRQRLARGMSIRYLVPETVARYIYRHQLYVDKNKKEEVC